MTRRIKLVVVALACALAVSACTSSDSGTTAPTDGTVITLDPDPGPGTETFTVATAPEDMLSAKDALSKFQSHAKEYHPPDDATYTFGYYTARIDSDSFRFKNAPAWAIVYHQCAAPRGPGVNSENTRIPCTHWVLLNARTGNLVETAWSP
jgi:hypothetical protein